MVSTAKTVMIIKYYMFCFYYVIFDQDAGCGGGITVALFNINPPMLVMVAYFTDLRILIVFFRKKSTRRERYVLILNMKTKLRKDDKYTVQTHLVFPMMPLPQLTRLYLHKMSDISCCRKWVGRLVSPWENQKQELLSRYVICPFHYITKSKMW